MQYNEAVDGGGICVDMVYRDPVMWGDRLLSKHLSQYLQHDLVRKHRMGRWRGPLRQSGYRIRDQSTVMDDNYGASAGTIATKGSPVYVSNSILTDNDGNDVALAEDDIEGDSGRNCSWTHSSFYDNDGGFQGMFSMAEGNISGDLARGPRGIMGWSPTAPALTQETRASVTWMIAPIWGPLEALQPTGR